MFQVGLFEMLVYTLLERKFIVAVDLRGDQEAMDSGYCFSQFRNDERADARVRPYCIISQLSPLHISQLYNYKIRLGCLACSQERQRPAVYQ